MADIRVCLAKFDMAMKWLQTTYDYSQELGMKENVSTEETLRFTSRHRDLERYRTQMDEAFTVLTCSRQALKEEKRSATELEKCYDKFMDMFYSVQVSHSVLIETQQNTIESKQSVHTQRENEFHLPKINLMRFSGSHIEWPNFISIFNSLIHENQRLSSVQKMHYLLSVLDKEPLSLVKHLPISEENYIVTYDLLTERYENKRIIADKHVESILSLPNLTQVNAKTLNKFINTLKENTHALTALKFDVNSWSFLLLHIVLKKFPIEMRSKFESNINDPLAIPTFTQLLKFLESQLRILENIAGVSFKATTSSINVVNTEQKPSFNPCPCCKEAHAIYYCQNFNVMTPEQRKQFVIKHKLCFNCLRTHQLSKCISKSVCQVCRGRHHTKLHITEPSNKTSSDAKDNEAAVSTSSTVQSLHGANSGSTMVLGTALVRLRDVHGNFHSARALIDSGSQVSILTENLAQKLKLPRSPSGTVLGLGSVSTQQTHGIVSCVISPIGDPNLSLSTDCIVLKRITGNLPSVQVDNSTVKLCKNLVLADKYFTVPGPIDMLLGVDVYDQILDGRKFSLGHDMPTAYSSIFGWIIMGKAPASSPLAHSALSMACTLDLDLALTWFWDVEEAPSQPVPDPEDVLCEKHFSDTHTRDNTGRFIVRLPFKVNRKPLGNTHASALKRFYNLERRLVKDAPLLELYIAFMRDYENAGHMREVLAPVAASSERYYIPHHGVLRAHSSTTKLRAVFDASSASSTGVSLNQVLMPGPKLQKNIEDIILRFRTHQIVFTCDIKQMYRQVRLAEDDCKFQTIFWRECPEEPIRQYELTTVTYGVTSSAFQAIRVIHELAYLNEALHPAASRVLLEDTFVDDVCSGAQDLPSALDLQQKLVSILSQGGFILRKWSSNSDDFLKSQSADHCELPFRFEEDGSTIYKVLGMEWNAKGDNFIYRVSPMKTVTTKREILSNIARLYDPCGFLAPITFFAKHLMQTIWALQQGWDDPLPSEIIHIWDNFNTQFSQLNEVSIPRWLLTDQHSEVQLHGFSDASERGYAACVYLRVQGLHGSASVRLLLAKSRVAPLKQRLTVPKLELNGAHLLARLLHHVLGILGQKFKISSTVAWCDSSIVLAWLKVSPHKLQTFEGNRVSQIQALVPNAEWSYVPSARNPADSASRGITPSELVAHPLWWSPPWLAEDCSTWREEVCLPSEINLPGFKSAAPVSNVAALAEELPVLTKFGSFPKLQSVVAWCKRYIHNSRNQHQRRTGPLTVAELNDSLLHVVKLVQSIEFSDTLRLLRDNKPLKGSIRRLNPFLDSQGHLRVGGRLVKSELDYSAKHPLLLPKSHHVTKLIVDHYHRLFLHPGLMALTCLLQRKFWILSARRVIRQQIFQCQRCYQLRPKSIEPFMGNLPVHRVTSCRPFQKVGVDFAGPFLCKTSRVRNAKSTKAYLCIFVCFTTKCVHLEIVSELSTDAFLACLDRFVSRRGLPSDIFSDCGTNFIGTRNYLKHVSQHFKNAHDEINKSLANLQITWHLNPPSGPHMGGLWESAVRSAKLILARVIGDRPLSFEELGTVFAKVEAALNSRPLCPLTNDPNDLEALTPGHFLICQPLQSLPEQSFDEVSPSLLKRWQLLRQITQHFWRRWHSEFLHTMQQRPKWLAKTTNLQVGDLVLVKDPNLPPLHWKKGRIIRTCPGSDGTVRVVELRTSNGILLRPVVKLCPLLPCLDM